MTDEEIHKAAVRLVEGGIVQIGSHWVIAKKVSEDENPCYICEMDSICTNMDMINVCAECEAYSHSLYRLDLVCTKK